MVMGDVMNKVILGKKIGINWGVSQLLEDLDFADDIYLLSHAFNKIYMTLKRLMDEGEIEKQLIFIQILTKNIYIYTLHFTMLKNKYLERSGDS
jgi:hypothetical protein